MNFSGYKDDCLSQRSFYHAYPYWPPFTCTIDTGEEDDDDIWHAYFPNTNPDGSYDAIDRSLGTDEAWANTSLDHDIN